MEAAPAVRMRSFALVVLVELAYVGCLGAHGGRPSSRRASRQAAPPWPSAAAPAAARSVRAPPRGCRSARPCREFLQCFWVDVVVGPAGRATGVHDAGLARLLEVMGGPFSSAMSNNQRQLAHAHLSSMLSQHVDQLPRTQFPNAFAASAIRSACSRSTSGCAAGSQQGFTRRPLLFWRELQIDSHRSTCVD